MSCCRFTYSHRIHDSMIFESAQNSDRNNWLCTPGISFIYIKYTYKRHVNVSPWILEQSYVYQCSTRQVYALASNGLELLFIQIDVDNTGRRSSIKWYWMHDPWFLWNINQVMTLNFAIDFYQAELDSIFFFIFIFSSLSNQRQLDNLNEQRITIKLLLFKIPDEKKRPWIMVSIDCGKRKSLHSIINNALTVKWRLKMFKHLISSNQILTSPSN